MPLSPIPFLPTSNATAPVAPLRSHPLPDLVSLYPDVNSDHPVFALPQDEYQPRMRGSAVTSSPGTRALRTGWQMCPSEEMPDPRDPGWRPVEMPCQWAVTDPEMFSHGGSVWFKKDFTVAPLETGPDKNLALSFEGVDYEAEAYLNGKRLGTHRGYFEPFGFDINDQVRPGERNTLLVKVSAPADPWGGFLKTQFKGVFAHHDCRPGPRPGYNALHLNTIGTTGGIWNDVLLRSTGRESIEAQHVETELSDDLQTARLVFHAVVRNHSDSEREVTVTFRYAPEGETDPERFRTVSAAVRLAPGENPVEVSTVEPHPHLWWSHDLGKPELYRLQTSVRDGDEDGDEVSDARDSHFGIRRVAFDNKTGRLELNGRPVFQRGINYVPTQWLSTYDEAKYGDDLRKMKEAHLNAVRVHGCVLPHAFYDQADREGVLVWADFPLLWGMNPLPGHVGEAKRQYREMIEGYRGHPSIFLWGAHNEPFPWDFFTDRALDRVAAELDDTRGHKASSPISEHFYPGWYYPFYEDHYYEFKRAPQQVTEFGTIAVPRSLVPFVPPDARWPVDENPRTWYWFNLQPAPSQRYLGRSEAFRDLDDYVETTQKYQFDYTKYMIEQCRRHRFEPTTGTYPFMFKDTWPSASFGMLDYQGRPKMAWEALKGAMNPTLLSIEWKRPTIRAGENLDATLWLVNDRGEALPDGRLAWRFYRADDPEKRALVEKECPVDVPAEASHAACCVRFRVPEDASPGQAYVLEAAWQDSGGKVLSYNAFQCRVPRNDPQPFRYEGVSPTYPPAG